MAAVMNCLAGMVHVITAHIHTVSVIKDILVRLPFLMTLNCFDALWNSVVLLCKINFNMS